MADVVSLTGRLQIPVKGESNANLVTFLEEVLEKARSGWIVGMAGSCAYPSSFGTIMPADSFKVGWTDSFAVIGGLEDAKFLILRRLNEK